MHYNTESDSIKGVSENKIRNDLLSKVKSLEQNDSHCLPIPRQSTEDSPNLNLYTPTTTLESPTPSYLLPPTIQLLDNRGDLKRSKSKPTKYLLDREHNLDQILD